MKRHPFDPYSAIFGLFFSGLGLLFFVVDVDAKDLDPTWLWPLPLLLIGSLIAAFGYRRAARDRDVREPIVPDPVADPLERAEEEEAASQ